MSETRWWRDEGSERCDHCLQVHHVETAVWCTGCDARGCDFCITVIRVRGERRRMCPDCRET